MTRVPFAGRRSASVEHIKTISTATHRFQFDLAHAKASGIGLLNARGRWAQAGVHVQRQALLGLPLKSKSRVNLCPWHHSVLGVRRCHPFFGQQASPPGAKTADTFEEVQ